MLKVPRSWRFARWVVKHSLVGHLCKSNQSFRPLNLQYLPAAQEKLDYRMRHLYRPIGLRVVVIAPELVIKVPILVILFAPRAGAGFHDDAVIRPLRRETV